MMVFGATVAALATIVALLVVRSTPTLTVPAALQVGTSSGQTTPALHSTHAPSVIVVTPDQPVTDNDDKSENSTKSGESSTTVASQN